MLLPNPVVVDRNSCYFRLYCRWLVLVMDLVNE